MNVCLLLLLLMVVVVVVVVVLTIALNRLCPLIVSVVHLVFV